ALIGAAHARMVLYEVWPHRGDPSDDLEYQYAAYAADVRLMANVGEMWMRALARDPKLELYQRDDHHAAPAGTYLAACVLLMTLFNERCDGLPTFGLVTP